MTTRFRLRKSTNTPDPDVEEGPYPVQDDDVTDKQLQSAHTVRLKKKKKRGFMWGTLRPHNMELMTAEAAPPLSLHVDTQSDSELSEAGTDEPKPDDKVCAYIRDININWKDLETKCVRCLVIDDEDNAMIKLPDEIKRLKDLREFSLRWGKIKELPAALYGLPLTKITVTKCSLQNIDGIQVVGTLQELELVCNHIRNIPSGIGHLAQLQRLDVSGNKLKLVPESIGRLHQLTSMSLSANAIDALPITIGNMLRLKFINLSRNKLEFLPDNLGKLANLVTLQLTHNKLSDLPDTFGRLRSLKYLFLGHNKFTCIPAVIPSIPNLLDLNMHENFIQSVDIALPNLRALLLDKNQISELSGALLECKSLEILSLRSNKLSSITQGVSRLKKLKAIYMTGNTIQEIPDELSQLTDLRHLVVSQTRVNDLPNSLSKLKRLTVLDFSESLMNYELREAYKRGGLKQLQQRLYERSRESHVGHDALEPKDSVSYPICVGNNGYKAENRHTVDFYRDNVDNCSDCVSDDLRKDVDGRTSTCTTSSSSMSVVRNSLTSEGSATPCSSESDKDTAMVVDTPELHDIPEVVMASPEIQPVSPETVTRRSKVPSHEPPPPLHPRRSQLPSGIITEDRFVEELIAQKFPVSPPVPSPVSPRLTGVFPVESQNAPETAGETGGEAGDVAGDVAGEVSDVAVEVGDVAGERQSTGAAIETQAPPQSPPKDKHISKRESQSPASPENKPPLRIKPSIPKRLSQHSGHSESNSSLNATESASERPKDSDRASVLSTDSQSSVGSRPKPATKPKPSRNSQPSAENGKVLNEAEGSYTQQTRGKFEPRKSAPLQSEATANKVPKVRTSNKLASRITMFEHQ